MRLYLYSGSKFGHFLRPIRQLDNVAQRFEETIGSDSQQLKEFARWARTLANDVVGRPRSTQKFIDDFVRRTLTKLSNDSPVLRKLGFTDGSGITKAVTRNILTFSRAATIGFNPSTALINYGLLFTNVTPTLGGKTVLGAITKNFTKSAKYTRLFDRAGIDVIQGGAVLRTGLDETLVGGLGQKSRKLLDTMGLFLFNRTERHMRQITIVAARDQADIIAKNIIKKNGNKLSFAEQVYKETADRLELPVDAAAVKDQFAIDFMRRTNFDFDLGGLPEIFRNPLAKPALQFKTFMLREMEFLYGLRGFELFKAMGMVTALGGMFAIPGLNAMDLIGRSIFGVSPKLWAQQTFGDELSSGVPRLGGLDMSQRLTIDDLQFVADPNNVFGISSNKFFEFVSASIKGDFNRAKTVATPVAIRNVLNAKELLETGTVRSDFNDSLILSDKDIDNKFLQAAIVALGFEPNALRDNRSVRDLVKKRERLIRQRERVAKQRAVKALRKGDMETVAKIAKRYGFSLKEIRQSMNRKDQTQKEALQKTVNKDRRGASEFDLIN